MGQVIALIPARSGSKGIPFKNWRYLGGVNGPTLVQLAIQCAHDAGLHAVLSTDDEDAGNRYLSMGRISVLLRPAELATDTAPMIDVVKHAMEAIPGASDDIWLILQPTQPLRTPERVREAVRLLQETGADSVVSVVALPLTHHYGFQVQVRPDGTLWRPGGLNNMQTRRQEVEPTYMRDGTVYAFRRATVERYGHIYGEHVRALVLAPHETCELDTESQWAEVQARWERERG